MRQSRLMAMASATMMMSAVMNSSSPLVAPITAMPFSRNRKGELKKEFKHNPRNNRRTKPKRK